MEAIGLAASLVALIEAAGSTAKVVRAIHHRLRDVSEILGGVERDLHLIHGGLQQIQLLQARGGSSSFSSDGQQAVLATLESAQAMLQSIEMTCVRLEKHNGRRHLIQWALVDHPQVEKKLGELRALQSSLKTLFQIVALQEQSFMKLQIDHITSLLVDLSDKFESNRNTQPTLMTSSPSKPVISKRPQMCSYEFVSFPTFLRWFGCHISLVKLAQVWLEGSLKHYTLAFQLPILPGMYTFGGQITLRRTPYCHSLSLVAPSAISFGCIVPPDSAAMTACARGDIFTLKEQLKSGKATLSDTTSDRRSLMTVNADTRSLGNCSDTKQFAIQGGHRDVVEFLLDNGINVNVTFGSKQTSPLQWAIRLRKLDLIEMLISRGADVNHVSMLGWSSVFYLWPLAHMGQGNMLHQIDRLARADDIELNLTDKWGWTLLHRLAAYGTGLEVRKVINLGADLMIKQLPLGWPAIFHSVFYGNMETLVELMPYYPEAVTDERGWTLLHIAASAGHKDITRHLLKARVDPRAKSKPFFSHMPESIWGKRCTPAEVAAAQSRERLGQYEQLLEDLGLVLLGDGEDEEEEFWDAAEFIS